MQKKKLDENVEETKENYNFPFYMEEEENHEKVEEH